MAYSNSIPEWNGSEVTAGNQVGWQGQLWTAVITNTSEPSTTNTDWTLDTPLDFNRVTFLEIHEQGNTTLSVVDFNRFSLIETHVDRVDMIEFSSLTIKEYVDPLIVPTITTPDRITNIRFHSSALIGKQLETEKRITNN